MKTLQTSSVVALAILAVTLAPSISAEDGREPEWRPDLSHVRVGQRYLSRDSGSKYGYFWLREVVAKTDVSVRYLRYRIDSKDRQLIGEKTEHTWTVDSVEMPPQPWGEVDTFGTFSGTEFGVLTHRLDNGVTLKVTVSGGAPTFPGLVSYRASGCHAFFDSLFYVEETVVGVVVGIGRMKEYVEPWDEVPDGLALSAPMLSLRVVAPEGLDTDILIHFDGKAHIGERRLRKGDCVTFVLPMGWDDRNLWLDELEGLAIGQGLCER